MQAHGQTIPAWPTISASQVQSTDLFQLNGPRFVYNTFLTAGQLLVYIATNNGSVPTGTPGQIPYYASAGNALAAQGPFTAGLPIIGNGTSGLASGTKSGNTTGFMTFSGNFVNGDCLSNNNGNAIDAGIVCGGGGGSGTVTAGLAGQLAYYPSAGTAVAGVSLGTYGQFLMANASGAPVFVGPIDVTPQLYDSSCGQASHDCTTGFTDCAESGHECYLPCGTYFVPNGVNFQAADASGFGNIRGAGECTIVEGGSASASVLTVGGASCSSSPTCTTRTNFTISDLQIKSSVPMTSFSGYLVMQFCNQCTVRNIAMQDGNAFYGLELDSDHFVGVDNVYVANCKEDGFLIFNQFGDYITPTSLAVGCGNSGFHVAGDVNGIQIEGQSILNLAYGFEIDTSLVATKNTQFFFGPFATFDTNTLDGVFAAANSITSGGTGGIIFKGWSSSNNIGGGNSGILISNQGGIFLQIVGATIIGNGGPNIYDQDTGWALINDNFIFNSQTSFGIAGPGTAGAAATIVGNILSDNHSGGMSGFVLSGTSICTNNVGGSAQC